ncbi:hypothetical protein GW17_00029942 [Ensete ventricosum]|nr:hypothetical protein GW17_00029942 [Ensete ventricosum]
MQGRQPTARVPWKGATGHGQNPFAGVASLQGAAASRRDRPRAWLAPSGAAPAARPQVAVARCKAARGSPAARAIACKGTPAEGAAAHDDGVQHRRLCRGSGGGAEGGKERARASFCEKDDRAH